MARHRKSKANRVSVRPDATLRYVLGVLQGADNYILGVMSGASLYNAWVDIESKLQGKRLPAYIEDSTRKAVTNPEVLKTIKEKFEILKDPNAPKEKRDEAIATIQNLLPNYARVAKVDELMIEAGREYRKEYPELYQNKNIDVALAELENFAGAKGRIVDRVGNVMSKLVYSF